jgi:hypothetical protein
LARRASTSDYRGRAHNLGLWEAWLTAKLGASFKTAKITSGLVELALEEWKRETIVRRKTGAVLQRHWSSSYLRTRALHLSNLFGVLYPLHVSPIQRAKTLSKQDDLYADAVAAYGSALARLAVGFRCSPSPESDQPSGRLRRQVNALGSRPYR